MQNKLLKAYKCSNSGTKCRIKENTYLNTYWFEDGQINKFYIVDIKIICLHK